MFAHRPSSGLGRSSLRVRDGQHAVGPRGPAARGQCLPGHLVIGSDVDTVKLIGSVCAKVRLITTSDDLYALTCMHVAYRAGLSTTLAPDMSSRIYGEDIGAHEGQSIGNPAAASTVFDPSSWSVDAALVKIDPAGPAAAKLFWPNVSCTSIAGTREEMLSEWSKGASIYCRAYPGGLSVPIPDDAHLTSIQYEGGASVYLRELYCYRFDGPDAAGPGDSGGAIISGNGVLLGMHTAGTLDPNNVTWPVYGYAQPAYVLFDDSTFGIPYELA